MAWNNTFSRLPRAVTATMMTTAQSDQQAVFHGGGAALLAVLKAVLDEAKQAVEVNDYESFVILLRVGPFPPPRDSTDEASVLNNESRFFLRSSKYLLKKSGSRGVSSCCQRPPAILGSGLSHPAGGDKPADQHRRSQPPGQCLLVEVTHHIADRGQGSSKESTMTRPVPTPSLRCC